MVYEDFKQLTAYSRYDGFYLAIVWSASFACLLGTAFLPVLAQFSLLLTLSTPFFVAYRLRVFREEGRRGVISYRRSLLYCLRVFFNAALIFSLLQWLYMYFIDNGRLLMMVSGLYSSSEGKSTLAAVGIPTMSSWRLCRKLSSRIPWLPAASFLPSCWVVSARFLLQLSCRNRLKVGIYDNE